MSFTHLFPLGGKTNKPDILGSLEDSSADVQKGNINQIDEATNMTTELRLKLQNAAQRSNTDRQTAGERDFCLQEAHQVNGSESAYSTDRKVAGININERTKKNAICCF